MKKGQIVEGIVKEIQFPNKGMVEVEGEERKVIVKNVLPGQKVKASVNKIRKGKDVSWKSWRSHRKRSKVHVHIFRTVVDVATRIFHMRSSWS